MKHTRKCNGIGSAVLFGAFASCVSVQAAAITPAGTALGFTLTTVINNTPSSFPVGIALNSDGNIIFYNYSGGPTSVIKDIDNQNYSVAGTVLSTASNPVGVPGMAYAAGSVWMSGGSLRRLNNDGSTAQNFAGIPVGWGMWTNPVNGHLIAFANGTSSIVDIDVSNPSAPVVTTLKTGTFGDGLTVSPDGSKAYTSGGEVLDLVSASHPLTSFTAPSGADGMGVISSSNALNGSIIVNTTGSNIFLVDPVTFAQTLIATGNGYGDFTGPDWTNGTLLLGSGNSILRLSCGSGCGIGAPPPLSDSPEPATASLILLAGCGVLVWRRRPQSNNAAKQVTSASSPTTSR
jgi:hypothetical protein